MKQATAKVVRWINSPNCSRAMWKVTFKKQTDTVSFFFLNSFGKDALCHRFQVSVQACTASKMQPRRKSWYCELQHVLLFHSVIFLSSVSPRIWNATFFPPNRYFGWYKAVLKRINNQAIAKDNFFTRDPVKTVRKNWKDIFFISAR